MKPRRAPPARALQIVAMVCVILVAALAYFVYKEPCSDLLPCRDTPDMVTAEQRDLMRLALKAFNRDRTVPRQYRSAVPLPQPLDVRVKNTDAEMKTSTKIDPGSLQYAEAWYRVYHEYHRGTRSVFLHVAWNSGTLTQRFPLSEF